MIAAGTLVRAEYRGRDHTGVVLEVDDPRAWAGTIAFVGTPTAAEVRAHLAKSTVADVVGRHDKAPVLWSFGKIYWERTTALTALGLGEGRDWVLTRVDVSERSELVTEGVNLSADGRPFFWMVDIERTIAEPRYDWSRAEVTPAAQKRIDAVRERLAARAAGGAR